MTKEIAIHNLFALKLRSRVTSDREALDLAIKALEQQDTDLDGYSSRLWHNAYDRGKADTEAKVLDAIIVCKHMEVEE